MPEVQVAESTASFLRHKWTVDAGVKDHFQWLTAPLCNPSRPSYRSRERVPSCSQVMPSYCTATFIPKWPALYRTLCSSCAERCWTIPHTSRTCHRVCLAPSRKRERAVVSGRTRRQGRSGAVVPAATLEVLCRGNSSACFVNGMPASASLGTIFNDL